MVFPFVFFLSPKVEPDRPLFQPGTRAINENGIRVTYVEEDA